MKHQIVHTLQKYFLNPPIKVALALGLPLPGYALLETRGRKTGKPRRTPVGDGRVGNQFWLVAEHGMKAGYVRNIERDPHVRLKLRQGLKYRWHTGTAQTDVIQSPDERRDVGWFLCAFPCCVDCGCLLLRKAKRHIDPHALLHRILCRSKSLSRAWILDVRIGNPRKHFLPLAEHLLRGRPLIRENFDRHPSLADQWGDCLNDFLVFIHFLPIGEFVT